MKYQGRGVIRMHDQTDHGGKVISTSSSTTVMGLAAALEGDMTSCPRCNGTFAIKTDCTGAKHHGKHYAYHDDVAECGARLISSLTRATDAGFAEINSCMPTTAFSTENAPDAADPHVDKFLLIDQLTHAPLDGRSYQITHEFDSAQAGKTDFDGITERLKI